jgi:hypothetical protein
MPDDEKALKPVEDVRVSAGAALTTALTARNLADAVQKLSWTSSMLQAGEQIRAFEASLQRTTIEHAEALRAFQGSLVSRQILELAADNRSLMRTMIGPLEDLNRSPFLGLWRDADFARQAIAGFESRFQLPEATESLRIALDVRTSNYFTTMAKRFAEDSESLKSAIAAMQTPWVDVQESIKSMAAFAELQGIGHSLASMPSFGDHLAAELRVDLGDWRDRINWPTNIFTDLAARSEFYVNLGFNTRLADFPAPAFSQSLEIAGLHREPPPIVVLYASPVPRAESDDEEAGFVRTNVAHDWLQRLESHVRRFIDKLMTRQYGSDWTKHRLPNGLYDQWKEKKQKALEAGASDRPLIAYADFTDYEQVICKRDNWREVFGSFFQRPESVRESFQRLYLVRLDTMHARLITQDDELLLCAEVRRLFRVIAP